MVREMADLQIQRVSEPVKIISDRDASRSKNIRIRQSDNYNYPNQTLHWLTLGQTTP